jgi:hypothetical protein
MRIHRRQAVLVLGGALLTGCQDLMLRLKDPKSASLKKHEDNAIEALRGKDGHSKLIGDYISVSGYTNIPIESVGLVTGLDGTGEDVPASPYRTALLEDMKRHRVTNPNAMLKSTQTAMVLVKAQLPPLIKKGERFDVEITLPDGSQTTSLSGGWLLQADLKEHANVPGGGVREGHMLAQASGPILLATGEGDARYESASLRRGTIPGGAVYVGQENRNLVAMVRNDYQSAKLTHRIAQRIGERFHDYDEYGLQRPLAKATTDRKIELIVHDRYRDNYPRYLQVIRHIALRESPVERHMRIEGLRDHLMIAEECERAALELEAIGPESIALLKEGLKSPLIECRFRAGESLAYLGNPEGVDALKQAASEEPAFRIFALAALSTLDDGRAFSALLELMNHESVETRYGAFRALTTANPNDPNVRGVKMPGGFSLHVVETTGSPLVHLTRRTKAEIVLFGEDQQFSTPLVFRAGQRIIVKGDAGSDVVKVSRIAPGEPVKTREVSTRVGDVIRACSELEASYPDIVQLLVQAQHQKNLPGEIGIDELPQAMRVYRRPAAGGGAESDVPIGSEGLVPNIFQGETKPAAALSREETDEPMPKPEEKAKSKSEHTEVDLDGTTSKTP